jgi:hypothetical protein
MAQAQPFQFNECGAEHQSEPEAKHSPAQCCLVNFIVNYLIS